MARSREVRLKGTLIYKRQRALEKCNADLRQSSEENTFLEFGGSYMRLEKTA
jgi:hypothetical protein